MKKRIYRATHVKNFNAKSLMERVEGSRLVIGVDVAKSIQFAAPMLEDRESLGLFKWDQLSSEENALAFEMLGGLQKAASRLDLVLEPSGTYGDPLAYRAESMGLKVYRVNPKKTCNYAEVFDGVPSLHDGKSAMLLGRLHLEGHSRRWTRPSSSREDLQALTKEADLYQDSQIRTLNRLEAWAARHWPELGEIMDLGRTTVLKLLEKFGSPFEVARSEDAAEALLRKVGGHFLSSEKVSRILRSARRTAGVPAGTGDISYVRALARELLRSRKALFEVEARLRARGLEEPSIVAMSPQLGLLTAIVFFVEIGDPRDYPNARSYMKAAGMNLKERSSGRYVGRLKLTKRGSGRARRWLYLAALRLIQRDRITSIWYGRKVRRDGGKLKGKAVVAVMRKLLSAQWHVARGQEFDSSKLFNLGLSDQKAA